MSEVQRYSDQRAQAFAQNFETGYTEFTIGVILRQAREEAGLTQEEVAQRLHTKKSAPPVPEIQPASCVSVGSPLQCFGDMPQTR